MEAIGRPSPALQYSNTPLLPYVGDTMKQYNCCVVGIGAVGAEMVKLLRRRNFPVGKLVVFATRERTELIDGVPVEVLRASDGRLVVVGQPEPPAHHHDRHGAGRDLPNSGALRAPGWAGARRRPSPAR